jgi:hypothetical protein
MFGLPSFIVYIVVALILTKVPVVGKHFRLFNTLIHEIGHVLMSLLTSGKVYKVQIFSDTSGLAITGTSSWFSRVLTSLAGYPFSSFVAFGFLYLIHIEKSSWVLNIILAVLIASMVFWVRNWFGFGWTGLFFGITFGVHMLGTSNMVYMYLLLIIAVLLVESVWTSFVVLRLSILDRLNSGDAYNLSQSTKLPAIVWGIFFSIQSVYLLVVGYNFWL